MPAGASSSKPSLRVARVTHRTTAEGPGQRTAVWVQGCAIRCRGCINPHLFSRHGGTLTEPSAIVESAREAGDEGVTLLGGEPVDQIDAVGELARLAQDAGLGVICFTGYTIDQVLARPDGDALLRHVDLLVDGRYIEAMPEQVRALVGSSNQRFIHLTGRYSDYDPEVVPDRVDVRILPTGEVSIAGFLTADGVGKLASAVHARRIFKAD